MRLLSGELTNKNAGAQPKPDSQADLDKVVHFCASHHSN
jgi:hypothetical protein